MSTSKPHATHIAIFFLDHWMIPIGIKSYLLTENGPQFVSKFFASVCGNLRVKHLMTTAHHSQTSGQAKRFNRTIVTRI